MDSDEDDRFNTNNNYKNQKANHNDYDIDPNKS